MSGKSQVSIFPRAQTRHQEVTLTVDAVQQLYHLRQDKAAAQLGVCLTSFKAACRRLGIKRWPFTRTQGVKKMARRASELGTHGVWDDNLVAFFQSSREGRGEPPTGHGEGCMRTAKEDVWVGMGEGQAEWIEWFVGATDEDPVLQRWELKRVLRLEAGE
ncbi:hypothetical protein GUITHDRAFT_99832 [Guillardia theta CCMP2712]|uniref:RWP-RK domain-containing protein n=1 Tax=Guillardia theta (strain CCMP2712) TaxID=905079 RepID=L1K1N3_GUITC|nr:hypothetical protein GUITHDRAFT_99832 [Guillardia theta CCMP2712]EKX54350.1 hypothetical protein GUITHDRAFT_99832 [Guillardia theta CCMP2712]|eukprot:XP_005841330.1 hypothetical protein GUITHDRAFT_99832 [Guillardia theta CCMP2712]